MSASAQAATLQTMEATNGDVLSLLPASVLIMAVRSGATLEQLDLMLEIIACNKSLHNDNTPVTRKTKKIKTKLWDTLTHNVNALGAPKSANEWQKIWSKLTHTAKIRYSMVKMTRTVSGTKSLDDLSYYDSRVLEILGMTKTPLLRSVTAMTAEVQSPLIRHLTFCKKPETNGIQHTKNEQNETCNAKAERLLTNMFIVIEQVKSQIKDSLILMNCGFDKIINTTFAGAVLPTTRNHSIHTEIAHSTVNPFAVINGVKSQLKESLISIQYGFDGIVNTASALAATTTDGSHG